MIFWVVGAVLLVLAVGLLLWPAIRSSSSRDDERSERLAQNVSIAREKLELLKKRLHDGEISQQTYDEEFADLEVALALELTVGEKRQGREGGTWMMPLIALVVPIFSVSLYATLGDYRLVQNPALAEAPSPERQMTLEEMQTAIRERLRDNPDDARGWYALGRTLMIQQAYDKAVTSFQRAYDLTGEEPAILFSLADALALNNGGNLLGEPEQLVKRGLALDPEFPNGLWLAGLAAEQREDHEAAYQYWAKLLPMIQNDPQSAGQVAQLLQQLRNDHPEIAASSDQEPLQNTGVTLTVNVSLATDLAGQASDSAALFVYAKAHEGPPMPLAVKRFTVADLPLEVKLSDADAMMPALKLSAFDRVVIGARISPSGNPVAQPGDLYVESDVLGTGSADGTAYQLVINRVR